MEKYKIEKLGITYGLLVTAALIAYFLLMKLFGLVHNFELRTLNALFLFGGIHLAIKKYKSNLQGSFEFLHGGALGLLISIVTAVLFSVFVSVYTLNNPDFMMSIKENEPQGWDMNAFGIAILIFIEAFASGFLFTYLSMQWHKRNINPKIEGE